MEVVSTSNLVSSDAKKATITCNFQTMNINPFVMPHDLRRDQIGKYGYMQILSYSSFHDGRTVKECPKKHKYKKTQQN